MRWKVDNLSSFIRSGTYSLADVLPYIQVDLGKNSKDRLADPKAYKVYDGKKVWMARKRYKVFVESTVCCICGIEGEFFALEQQKEKKENDIWFLHLYGRTKGGNEILFTQDHAVPKSKGGSNGLDNLQTMCSPCNNTKGNKMPTAVEKSGKRKNEKKPLFVSKKEADWARKHLTKIVENDPNNTYAARLGLKFANLLLDIHLNK